MKSIYLNFIKKYFILLLLVSTFLTGCSTGAKDEGKKNADKKVEESIDTSNRYKESIFEEIEETKDIIYGKNKDSNGEEIELSLDFYEPKNDKEEERPLVILIHGGGFVKTLGNKSMFREYAEELAGYGYAAATIEYRTYDGSKLPITKEIALDVAVKARSDTKSAIRFFRKDSEENNKYKIDPDNIFLLGGSAGAITSLYTAYIDESDTINSGLKNILDQNGGIEGNSGNEGYSSEVQGVINIAGAFLSTGYLNKNDPPLLSIHGDADPIVPYGEGTAQVLGFVAPIDMYGSFEIDKEAKQVGMESELMTIEGGNHYAAENCDECDEKIINFLLAQISK